MNKKLTSREEYYLLINLCERAILRTAKSAGLDGYVTGEYQGCEFRIKTEVYADAKVVVLIRTDRTSRLPKYITLTVHGVISHSINKRLHISGGGLGTSEKSFLPENISADWLKKALLKAADTVRQICTTQNMEKLRKLALAKRREDCKIMGNLARFTHTSIKAIITDKK